MFRCPDCRTRRADYKLFLRHVAETKHKVCHCGGYHYAHCPGSPYCIRNPWSAYRDAERRGEDESVLVDIAIETALDHSKPGGIDPPF